MSTSEGGQTVESVLERSDSSIASFEPVDAPEGTAARPETPDSSATSASIVGLPRESRISRAMTSTMALMFRDQESVDRDQGRHATGGVAARHRAAMRRQNALPLPASRGEGRGEGRQAHASGAS